jgi:hypothetical protein
MEADSSKYLLDECDGLITNNSKPHSLEKWRTIRAYINIAMTAVKKRHWRGTFYIDLQSGPGKNRIGNECKLGSALIALTATQSFTHYRFNEIRPKAAYDVPHKSDSKIARLSVDRKRYEKQLQSRIQSQSRP